MTYADAFHKIKTKLAKVNTSELDSNFAIQVTLKDEDAAGTFYVAYINGEFSVEPYDYRDNTVAIDVTTDNFLKLVTGRIKADKALADGRIEAFGDSSAINHIAGIAKAPAKKPTAKKVTPQKTTDKKQQAKSEKKSLVKAKTSKKSK